MLTVKTPTIVERAQPSSSKIDPLALVSDVNVTAYYTNEDLKLDELVSCFHVSHGWLANILLQTSNHYKWDWPKSQFCMPDDSATVVYLRNIKIGNVYLFNFLQNTLKRNKFLKMGNKKIRKCYFS